MPFYDPAKYLSARKPGRKKYAPPRTVTNCGTPVTRRRTPPSCGMLKLSVTGQPPYRLAVADQRIALPRQARERRAHHPRVLQELELARDVRVEADEMQSALRIVRRRRLQRVGRRQPGPVLASAPQDRGESEQTRSGRPGSPFVRIPTRRPDAGDRSDVRGSRCCAGSRAGRARRDGQPTPSGSSIEGELIQANLVGLAPDAGNGLVLDRHQRIARPRAADQRRGELLHLRRIPAGLLGR